MALSGPQAIKSLDEAVRDIRREEEDVGKKLARISDRTAKLSERQAALYRELAMFRLTDERRDDTNARLSAAEIEANALIERHRTGLVEVEKTVTKLDRDVAALARKRRLLLDEIDKHQQGLKSLSKQIAAEMSKDPAYEQQRSETERLQKIAVEAMTKTEQAEADQETKGKPYRDDPLFMYLWETGYGTRNYKANNLVRWLDGIVARMVRYQDARPNFAMLNEIPMRLRDHAEHQAEIAAGAERKLDELEQAAIDSAGGKPMRLALEKARTQIDELDAKMVALEDTRDEAAVRLREFTEGRDDAFERAATLLADGFEATGMKQLLALAEATPSPRDDDIVLKLGDIFAGLAELDAEARDHKDRLKALTARRREIEDIEFEFKKARFDDPRSVFREDNLAGDVLNQFLRGAITAAVYWNAWQKSQSWRPGTTDWGGGIGLPHSGRTFRFPNRKGSSTPGSFPTAPRGGPSGFSRPRTGVRGTRRSGGFKTGGGF